LTTVPTLTPTPPDFIPRKWLTEEQLKELGIMENEFLMVEERKLVAWVLGLNKRVLVFDKSHKGRLREDMFPPVVIPIIKHKPWAVPPLPIPPGIHNKVLKIIKAKVAAGIYEPSTSSYRHQWFCVAKKDGDVQVTF
jgi:hypothetical protein